jgi:hypothetical protein
MEMSLALIGIILNMIVLISIKEKEALAKSTVTIVLANLCFSNLVRNVFPLFTIMLQSHSCGKIMLGFVFTIMLLLIETLFAT